MKVKVTAKFPAAQVSGVLNISNIDKMTSKEITAIVDEYVASVLFDKLMTKVSKATIKSRIKVI